MKNKCLFLNFNQKSNKNHLRFTFRSMVEGRRKVKKLRVLHRTPTFGLDVQIMTPLRWPERCAHDSVGGHVGGPCGAILPVKNNEKSNFLLFNFNQKSNKNPLRFTFSSMVERSRKVKKLKVLHRTPTFGSDVQVMTTLKKAWKVRAWFGWWPGWGPLGASFPCKKQWKPFFACLTSTRNQIKIL